MAVVMMGACVVAAPTGAATHAFSGNVCTLFTAKQAATIVADAKASKYTCVSQPPQTTRAATNYEAKAGSATVSAGGFFAVTVAKYKSPSTEKLIQAEFKTLKPVPGIGDWAYSHIAVAPVYGGTADTGELVVGAKGYSVLIDVRAVKGKMVNQAALDPLARSIVATL
jgi:hypothetical protein